MGSRLELAARRLARSGTGQLTSHLDLVAAGDRRQVRLEPEELSRLAPMMRARAVVLNTWSFCLGRKSLAGAAAGAAAARELAEATAPRARAALAKT
jgi:hypothetical protein